jgi:hypothetical protein
MNTIHIIRPSGKVIKLLQVKHDHGNINYDNCLFQFWLIDKDGYIIDTVEKLINKDYISELLNYESQMYKSEIKQVFANRTLTYQQMTF